MTKCYCNTVIGLVEDEDEMLVPKYRYCPEHNNEDRWPFLAKNLDDLHGVRLNKAGREWREELRTAPERLKQIEKFKKELGIKKRKLKKPSGNKYGYR